MTEPSTASAQKCDCCGWDDAGYKCEPTCASFLPIMTSPKTRKEAPIKTYFVDPAIFKEYEIDRDKPIYKLRRVTPLQHLVMKFIYKFPIDGGIGDTEINLRVFGGTCGISQNNAPQVTKALKKKGYLEKKVYIIQDRFGILHETKPSRHVRWTLTDKGLQHLKENPLPTIL